MVYFSKCLEEKKKKEKIFIGEKENAIIFRQKIRVWAELPNIKFAEGTRALVSPKEGDNSGQTA